MVNFQKDYMAYFWFAYAFHEGQGGNLVKIGRTGDIRSRHNQISTSSPYDCWKIWGVYSPLLNSRQIESSLHQWFGEFRTNREWFIIPTLDLWDFEKKFEVLFVRGTLCEIYHNGELGGGYFPSEYPPGHEKHVPTEYPPPREVEVAA